MPPEVEAALRTAWWRAGARSLYASFEGYRQLVTEVGWSWCEVVATRVPAWGPAGIPCLHCNVDITIPRLPAPPPPPLQVLSRDIRSVTQRVKVPQRAQQGGPAALAGGGGASGVQQEGQQEGYWKVVLDGIELSYDVEPGTADVVLRTARLLAA